MLAVGKSRLASNALTLPKLNSILAGALKRNTPFSKSTLPLFTSILLREYATTKKAAPAAKKAPVKKKTVTKKATPVRKPATATKKPAAKTKKTSTTPRARNVVKKKPAPKKKPVAKKKKPVVKKKKAVVKKPKGPTIAELKKTALLYQPAKTISTYTQFQLDMRATDASYKDMKILDASRAIAVVWKGLSDGEKKVYRDRAAIETRKRLEAYDDWLANLTPAQIIEANRARVQLRRQSSVKSLKDHFKRADFSHLPVTERTRQISVLWKSASAAEKKKYADLAERDKARFQAEKTKFAATYNV